ncbi:MAG TPA: Gfo/Idh/MocA family oxidoreductase [Terriglobales bacterium]|nr:Gfo/Idh/MocA family oxidoreductase [Terriglobales bacterium]
MIRGPVSLVLAGIGGMGAVYVGELLDHREAGTFRIAGAVDPEPERCPRLEELRAGGVAVFASLESFYRNRTAELAVVSSPIQHHADQTCLALAKGSHVLCEKPVAGTIGEARRMMEAERESGRWVSVGYQWSFSPAVQELKSDIMAGRFGRPRRLKCLYLWPRDEAYYRRNDWAGRKRDAAGGWILDGPAQNAMAHDLHNMFYVLGPERRASARPVEVEAELYRAYGIENYDTAAVRARTADGVEVLLYATHVPRREKGPVFAYEFERATVRCSSRTSGVWAELEDGGRKDYGLPDKAPMAKLWQAIRNVRSGEAGVCGLEAASSQTLCVDGMQDSMPEVRDFPAAMQRTVEEDGARRVAVEGLDEALEAAYAADALPSELGFPWTACGRLINLGTQYSFPNSAGPSGAD